MAVVSLTEILLLLVTVGGPLNQFLGLPPGERDGNLVHVAPEESLLYIEWAARSDGEPGAPGIDGLVADPEVVEFVDRLKSAIEKGILLNTGVDQVETFKVVPDLVLSLTGSPGCLFWGLDTEAVGEDVPPQLALAMAIRVGVVVNAGDAADAITDNIKSMIAAGTGREPDKLDHTPLPLPAPVQIHRHDNYLIVANGPNGIDDIIKRLDAKAGGITNHTGFAAGWKDLGMDRSGLVTFLDIENGIEKIGDLTFMRRQIDQGLQFAGIAGAKWAMSVSGVSDGQIINRGHIDGISGEQGLMALVSGRGIQADDFALVPDDSDVVVSVSADPRKLFTALKTYVGARDPNGLDEINAAYEQFGEYLGIDFERDVFASLDNVLTLSNSPGDGGLIGTSPVLTIGIKNARGAAKTSTKIVETLERELTLQEPNPFFRRGVTVEQRDFMGTDILMINTIGEDDIVVAPAWCLTETHVMIALHPQALKSRLRRIQAEDWTSFRETFEGGPEGETVLFSAVDIPSVLPQVYGVVPWVAQVAMSQVQSRRIEMNLYDLPSLAALQPYMSDARSYLVRTPEGLSKYSEGPPVLGGFPSLGPALFISGMGIRRAPRVEALEVVEAVEEEVLVE